MLVLMLLRVSSRVSGFPVASPCLWGKLQNLSFWQAVMSICVAGAALCDIPTCLITRRKPCGRRKTFALLSQDELQFSWQAQHFGDLCRNFAWQAQHSTLHPLHFTLHPCAQSTETFKLENLFGHDMFTKAGIVGSTEPKNLGLPTDTFGGFLSHGGCPQIMNKPAGNSQVIWPINDQHVKFMVVEIWRFVKRPISIYSLGTPWYLMGQSCWMPNTSHQCLFSFSTQGGSACVHHDPTAYSRANSARETNAPKKSQSGNPVYRPFEVAMEAMTHLVRWFTY